MALTRLSGTNAISGTLPAANINNTSIGNITALPAGVGGKVLQVVTATDETERSATSSSYVTGSNNLSISITPSSTSSKIYVTSTFEAGTSNMGGATAWFTLYRNSTNLGASSEGLSRMFISGLSGQTGIFNQTLQVLDSPSSTSSLVYQVYMKGDGGSHITYINKNSVKGTITAFEIAG